MPGVTLQGVDKAFGSRPYMRSVVVVVLDTGGQHCLAGVLLLQHALSPVSLVALPQAVTCHCNPCNMALPFLSRFAYATATASCGHS